jgi:hypothetical protein
MKNSNSITQQIDQERSKSVVWSIGRLNRILRPELLWRAPVRAADQRISRSATGHWHNHSPSDTELT